jgi:hypothetical protein
VAGYSFNGAAGCGPGRVSYSVIPVLVAEGKPLHIYGVMSHLLRAYGCTRWVISIFAAPGQTLHTRSAAWPAVLYITLRLSNWAVRLRDPAACDSAQNGMFLSQVTALHRGRGTGFAVRVVGEATGVGQIILDHFSKAIVYTGLIPFRQMPGGEHTGHTERRGKRFRSEYQGNAQVPQKPDVGASVGHTAQKKHIPASLYPCDDWRDEQTPRLFGDYLVKVYSPY